MSVAGRQGRMVGKKTPAGVEETADVMDHCLILGLTRAFVGLPHTFRYDVPGHRPLTVCMHAAAYMHTLFGSDSS